MAAPAPDEVYRGVTRLFAVLIVGFGIAIIAVTLANGGGPASAGLWIGLLFTALGVGRLYLALRGSGRGG
jgi:hypothetical protein